jgi:hypothetical protein
MSIETMTSVSRDRRLAELRAEECRLPAREGECLSQEQVEFSREIFQLEEQKLYEGTVIKVFVLHRTSSLAPLEVALIALASDCSCIRADDPVVTIEDVTSYAILIDAALQRLFRWGALGQEGMRYFALPKQSVKRG